MVSKRSAAALLTLFSLTFLAGCGGSTSATAKTQSGAGSAKEAVTLKVGVTAGPHEEIMQEVAKLLEPEQIKLDIQVFTDYRMPNEALANKELAANSFQHLPYLEKEIEERGFKLASAGTTINAPMGVYSQKIKRLDELKEGDTVALPNDPTNGGRALLVFQSAGLIKVDPAVGVLGTAKDIVENPKKLIFKELDAAQLPRVLPDVAAAAINTNFAMDAGLQPGKDAIYLEPNNGPYANVIAVREEDKENPAIQKLVEVYHSAAIRQFIETKYQGNFQPAW